MAHAIIHLCVPRAEVRATLQYVQPCAACLDGLLLVCDHLADQINARRPCLTLQAIAAHSGRHAGIPVDWQSETLVTSGATEALAAAFLALLNAGDEVRRRGGEGRGLVPYTFRGSARQLPVARVRGSTCP